MTMVKRVNNIFVFLPLNSEGCLPFTLTGGLSNLYIEGDTVEQDLVSWWCTLLRGMQASQNFVK